MPARLVKTTLAIAMLFGAAAGLPAKAAPPDRTAVGIPDDIWTGKYGGKPAITVSRHEGRPTVSVVLPSAIFEGANDPGSVTLIVKRFLEQYGPPMCTDLIDFTVPHKHLIVQLGIQELDWSLFAFRFYKVSPRFAPVIFDYVPAVQTKCVEQGPPTS